MPSCRRRRCYDATMAMVRCAMFTSWNRTIAIVTSCHRHRMFSTTRCYDAMMLRWQWHDVTTDVTMAKLRWRSYDVTMTMARCYDGDWTMWTSCYRHRGIVTSPSCRRYRNIMTSCHRHRDIAGDDTMCPWQHSILKCNYACKIFEKCFAF